MTCPTKRKGSDNWYYRRTIPADVQKTLAKIPLKRWPPNFYKTHISISLRTPDRNLAKAKCPEVAVLVEAQIEALRKGPKPLQPKQIVALSGDAYRAFSEGLEADPVLTVEQWRKLAIPTRGNQLAIYRNEDERREADEKARERRFGGMADALLARRNIVTDEDSRKKLVEQLSKDIPKAAEKLARNAEADYSEDAYAKRFPTFETEKKEPVTGKSLSALTQAWHDAALARGVRKRSAKKFLAITQRFGAWLKNENLDQINKADVLQWTDELVHEGKSAATINKGYLAALKTVFEWGVDRGWLEANPVPRSAKLTSRGKTKVRDPFFTNQEIQAILKGSLSVPAKDVTVSKTGAAKRWVPWLCAYSGARVLEVIQLRKQDIRKEEGVWIMRLTPEAGGIKTNQFRDVPIHHHLIKQGFLDFVKRAKKAYLFGGDTHGKATGVYNRLRPFIRKFVPDSNVQPSHAWRYTFKTIGAEAGIEELVLDAICGHAASHQGRAYTKVTLKKRAEAIKKFPRYKVT